MTKSEFVDQVADRAGLSKKDAANAVDAFLDTVENTLSRGSEITFSGFGKFSVSQRSAREGRNPATGATITRSGSTWLRISRQRSVRGIRLLAAQACSRRRAR